MVDWMKFQSRSAAKPCYPPPQTAVNISDLVVAVIIPFYQKEAGLLKQAVLSAFSQVVPEGIGMAVIVANDSSPLPPEVDLDSLEVPPQHSLNVLNLRNGGPGHARNAGIDYARTLGSDFIAFLDSDDYWAKDHISNALKCLADRFDFYFCDHYRSTDGTVTTGFERSLALQAWLCDDSSFPVVAHPTQPECYAFVREGVLDAFLSEYLAQTATVVYRLGPLSTARFDADLRTAGEDRLFWLTLVSLGAQVCFSTCTMVHCGRGVNIYYSALDWDHVGAARRLADRALMFQKIAQLPALDTNQRAFVCAKRWATYQVFAYVWFRSVFQGRADWRTIKWLLKVDPITTLSLPFAAAVGIFKRIWSAQSFGQDC